MEVTALDAIDRQIVHILTIEPRASFRTLADVTGISDQTAARRYRRLTESAGLRVLGVIDGSRLGWVDWFLRLQTTPGSADSIAEALARRPDTSWVRLASGGTEIICTLQARTAEQRDALFLRGLPGSRRVVQISAHSILHDFTPGAVARDAPRPVRRPAGDVEQVVSREDRHPCLPNPFSLSASRGRAPAGRTGPRRAGQPRRARRRYPLARIDGPAPDRRAPPGGPAVLRGRLDNRVLGLHVHAMLWLSVEPARLDEAGRALAAHPRDPVRRGHHRADATCWPAPFSATLSTSTSTSPASWPRCPG